MIGDEPRIHPTARLEEDVVVGARTAIWDHAHLRRGARVGRDCILGEKAYLAPGVVVGDLVKINACAYLCAGVTVEDGCMIAAHVVFTNDVTPRATDPLVRRLRNSEPGPHTRSTVVRRGATIGANATIGPGLELGSFCMVGMGAVVTRDVPAHALVVGNPARVVGLVDREGAKVLNCDDTTFPASGTKVPCSDGGWLEVGLGVVTWHSSEAPSGDRP